MTLINNFKQHVVKCFLLLFLDLVSFASRVFLKLVFLVFTGEAWGYLGSRRFLVELDMGADATKGLNSTLIEQVILLVITSPSS